VADRYWGGGEALELPNVEVGAPVVAEGGVAIYREDVKVSKGWVGSGSVGLAIAFAGEPPFEEVDVDEGVHV